MSTLRAHYRITHHIVSSVYELARTLVVTHRRARRLAMYQPLPAPSPTLPW